ncbi:hypothetical protein BDR26DRAFT_899439 [Obelidium mucronatum]|nr:hypothetical protein BDR26DRAFT_899439 [Obelidium mucronatum]
MKSAIICATILCASYVNAHGMMVWPIARPLPGDQQNGYTYARAASNRNVNLHPDSDINCSFLPKGPVFTQTMAPGPATLEFHITAFHMGGCTAYISTDNQKTWTVIGQDATCGWQSDNPSGKKSMNVMIPQGSYSAVIRWMYLADNGGAPNEFFNNCADVVVSQSAGNNKHDVFPALPLSPSAFYNPSCPSAGATLCASNGSPFINQCVSLAAGGGYQGGTPPEEKNISKYFLFKNIPKHFIKILKHLKNKNNLK